MKKIVLYGAGRKGKKVANILKRKNIEIMGFCDTNISGQKIEWGGECCPYTHWNGLWKIKKNV